MKPSNKIAQFLHLSCIAGIKLNQKINVLQKKHKNDFPIDSSDIWSHKIRKKEVLCSISSTHEMQSLEKK